MSHSAEEWERARESFIFDLDSVHNLGNKFLIPGLVDTHAHAPQYTFTGKVLWRFFTENMRGILPEELYLF